MIKHEPYDDWRNYCWICEWCHQCCQDHLCPYFHPPSWMDFCIAEIVDDQDMRQEEYRGVMAEFGGDD